MWLIDETANMTDTALRGKRINIKIWDSFQKAVERE